ncbi:peptidoglycan-binding domain-containing protein [Desulfosporosinus fructosivorans]
MTFLTSSNTNPGKIAYSIKVSNSDRVIELRILRIGATGDDVIELQSTLSILRYKPGVTDGIYGVKTASDRRGLAKRCL